MACIVELRGHADAELREILREGVPLLVSELARHDRTLPKFVAREFEAYLGCRDPARGFAWLHCKDCDHHRCVLFSCKTRGFCPSCTGRRMNERAAHWVDRVLPLAATRQWVVTVPWRRRWLLARRSDLAEGLLQVALRCIARWYRDETGRHGGQTGSITAIQRFGSALTLNLHFHVIHLDGVYDRGQPHREGEPPASSTSTRGPGTSRRSPNRSARAASAGSPARGSPARRTTPPPTTAPTTATPTASCSSRR